MDQSESLELGSHNSLVQHDMCPNFLLMLTPPYCKGQTKNANAKVPQFHFCFFLDEPLTVSYKMKKSASCPLTYDTAFSKHILIGFLKNLNSLPKGWCPDHHHSGFELATCPPPAQTYRSNVYSRSAASSYCFFTLSRKIDNLWLWDSVRVGCQAGNSPS